MGSNAVEITLDGSKHYSVCMDHTYHFFGTIRVLSGQNAMGMFQSDGGGVTDPLAMAEASWAVVDVVLPDAEEARREALYHEVLAHAMDAGIDSRSLVLSFEDGRLVGVRADHPNIREILNGKKIVDLETRGVENAYAARDAARIPGRAFIRHLPPDIEDWLECLNEDLSREMERQARQIMDASEMKTAMDFAAADHGKSR